MKRVCILGSPGAGKSTLAQKLHDRTGLPLVHLDQLFWKAGWVQETHEAFDKKHEKALAADKWIIDGMYSRTWEKRLEAVDTIILLDYSRWLCLSRALKRIVTTSGRVRPDMSAGCPEKLDWHFMLYIWNFHSEKKKALFPKIEAYKDKKTVLHFKNPKQTQAWLDRLQP